MDSFYKLTKLSADSQFFLSRVDSVWQNREQIKTNDYQGLWTQPIVSFSIIFYFA